MADKTTFVGAYRQAVTNFTAAYLALRDLRLQYTALGYDAIALGPIFSTAPNTDISAAEFVGAVSSMDAVDTLLNNGVPAPGAHLTNIYKLKP
jgi:hypothetical protein